MRTLRLNKLRLLSGVDTILPCASRSQSEIAIERRDTSVRAEGENILVEQLVGRGVGIASLAKDLRNGEESVSARWRDFALLSTYLGDSHLEILLSDVLTPLSESVHA